MTNSTLATGWWMCATRNRRRRIGAACAAMLASAVVAAASDAPVFELTLANGRFEPSQLTVPADTALQLRVTNNDTAAIEFESFELHRERVVQPGETITVYLPALKAGAYPFFDDFHSDTPPGSIVSK